jgi:mannose/cellobiose epimerase-like protein (N-acyl-D-glucosamine 2-epimerase family)
MDSQYADDEWLTERIQRILSFYYPDCLDDHHGGYIAQLDYETGEIYDTESKHLVATSRFVVNFSLAARHGGPEWAVPAAERGVSFLRDHHRDPETGGYGWLLRGTQTVDDRRG